MNDRRNEIKKSLEIGDKESTLLREIGYYYHNLYVNDLNKAYTSVEDLSIHKVVVDTDYIYICLERPGLLIGTKGSNIEALQKYLKERGFTQPISIIEFTRSPLDYLTSWQYMYFDEV